ncbi:MAG: class I SAM-dependent methyltransferase [Bdellovibrionales bacterium]
MSSTRFQLDLIGILLVAMLAWFAWSAAHPLTWYSLFPLLCFGYAGYRIVFELTFNRKNVPSLATGYKGRRKIAEILRRDADQRGKEVYTVVDLGSGRGELARRIAKNIPNAKVIGIELARIPFLQASFIQKWLGPKNVSYLCCDFWPYDCSNVDAVVFYLTPRLAEQVGEKLRRELKPRSIIISHTFPLSGSWSPVEVLTYRSPFKETIYVYRQE